VRWMWEGKTIEEVDRYKYLGYIFQRNGGQEEQVKDRMRRGMAVIGQVWGIGKRRFGKDWGKRVWLFDLLVWAVLGYGVEIWGWKERKHIERVQERYMRWLMGVGWRVPGYLIREELQREKLRVRAGRRAWRMEERLAEGKGSGMARRYWEEMRRRARAGEELSGWEKERQDFFRERGVKLGAMEESRKGGWFNFGEIEKRDKFRDKEERWKRIRGSRFNKWCGLGEGVREGRYWEK